MRFLAISARFPLGTFLGHEATGQPAAGPDTARLQAALMQAASKGSLAREEDGDLRPTAESLAALRWMESYPPIALSIPVSTSVAPSRGSATSYRADGVVEKVKGTVRLRKVRKNQSQAVAVHGSFWWAWAEQIPAPFFTIIERMCADVGCLGESDSPVVLHVHDARDVPVEMTHRLAHGQGPFPRPGGRLVRTPTTGRADALEADYVHSRPVKGPTRAADRSSNSQRPASFQPTQLGLRTLDYRPIGLQAVAAPWNAGLALGIDAAIRRDDVVRFCAALHRTLTLFLGQEALPLLTGVYEPTVARPANRVAIHYVGPGQAPGMVAEGDGGTFLILLPETAEPPETELVARVAHAVTRLYHGALGERRVIGIRPIDVTSFWPERLADAIRFWRPALPLIPEMNRPRKSQAWTLDDTALLSLGHVLRDHLTVVPRAGEDVRRARVRAGREAGFWAGGSRRVPDSRVERYVHKAPPSLVIQPYTTTVHTAGTIPDRAAWAMGQSRHVGGGFMVPLDLSKEAADHLLGWSPC